MIALFGARTVEAALGERRLLNEVPASLWNRVIDAIAATNALPYAARRAALRRQPEHVRRLIVLFMVEHERASEAIMAALGGTAGD